MVSAIAQSVRIGKVGAALKRMAPWAYYVFWKLWQIIAVLLVLLAVLVSALKYSLPYANQYRTQIETLLREQFAVELFIGDISAEWRGQGPTFLLNNISFRLPQNSDFDLVVGEVALSLDFWQSLIHREWRSDAFELSRVRFTLRGASLLKTDTDVSEQEKEADTEQEHALEPLSRLFLGQLGHFSLRDSQFVLILPSGETHKLDIDSLIWQNHGDEHFGTGSFRVAGVSEDQLGLQLALTGNDLSDVAGTAYINAQNLDVSAWFKQYTSTATRELTTNINFASWLSIEQGQLKDIQFAFNDNSVSWQQGTQNRRLLLRPTAALLVPRADGWQLKTDTFSVVLGQREFTENQLFLDKTAQWQAWLLNLDMALVRGMLPLFAEDLSWYQQFDKLQASAKLHNLHVRYDAGAEKNVSSQWAVVSDFSHLGWNNIGSIPGFADLEGQVSLSSLGGKVQVQGTAGHILTGPLFRQAIAYDRLSAQFTLRDTEQGWQLSSHDIWLNAPELTVAAGIAVNLDAEPGMQLYAEVSNVPAIAAKNYYPLPYMPKATMAFLNAGIQEGKVELAQVLWQGAFRDFPFREGQGVFEVVAQVDQGQLQFDQQWPTVTAADVQLHFRNERMDIWVQRAQLAELVAENNVHIYIPDLEQADQLFIDINDSALVDPYQLSTLFAESPLPMIGEAVAQLNIDAPVKANAQVIIDLNRLSVIASGKALLDGQNMLIEGPGLPLQKVYGELKFVNENLTLENGHAHLAGLPLKFNLTAGMSSHGYRLQVGAQGVWPTTEIFSQFPSYWENHLNGAIPWDLDFDLFLPESGFYYNAQLTSDLQQLHTQFPAPYRIDGSSSWPLQAIVQGDQNSNLITVQVPNKLYLNAIFDNQAKRLDQMHVIVGEKDLGLSTYPFEVSVRLDHTDLEPWLPLLADILEPSAEPQPEWMAPLSRLTVALNQLTFSDVAFDDVSLALNAADNTKRGFVWDAQLRSTQAIGKGYQASGQAMRIDFDRLRVVLPEEPEPDPNAVVLSPEQILANALAQPLPLEQPWLYKTPAMDIRCADCQFGPYQLDRVRLVMRGTQQSLQIEQFLVERELHQLKLNGEYRAGVSNLVGEFKSQNFGALLSEYNLNSSIKDSSSAVSFALTWQDTPYSPHTPTLNGNINWALGEGYLAEVSDQGARLFSLLSLDSLVRKMRLDFRDVFNKGMFYNSMKGSIALTQGIAYTQDTYMDGVAGDLRVVGSTNLINDALNYELGFTPKVTSSIPVLVAWMVNPVSGLAALAIDKVIHSANVITELQFTLDGTIKTPRIIETERKSEEIVLPEPLVPVGTPQTPLATRPAVPSSDAVAPATAVVTATDTTATDSTATVVAPNPKAQVTQPAEQPASHAVSGNVIALPVAAPEKVTDNLTQQQPQQRETQAAEQPVPNEVSAKTAVLPGAAAPAAKTGLNVGALPSQQPVAKPALQSVTKPAEKSLSNEDPVQATVVPPVTPAVSADDSAADKAKAAADVKTQEKPTTSTVKPRVSP